MMKNLFITIAALLIFATSCNSQNNPGTRKKPDPEITTEELSSILNYIASDSLKGRYPGTEEDLVLAAYLSAELANAGLELQADKGRQPFSFSTGVSFSSSSSIAFGDEQLEFGDKPEFHPMSFSANGRAEGEIVYMEELPEEAGDGFREKIEGKFIMTREIVQEASHGMGGGSDDYRALRSAALMAADNAAAGILFISSSEGPVEKPEWRSQKRAAVSIPAVMLSPALAEKVLEAGATFSADISIENLETESFNATALLQGWDDTLAQQYIVIGAHHDHLGMGGAGTSSRAPDTVAVHHGADDNASGVAGVLELAEHIASREPARSVSFLTFGGEEMGLLGSKHYAENPTIDLEQVQAMINLDMIGRLNEERQIQIGGMGTSPVFRTLIDTINTKYKFSLKYSEAGYGPSDHSSFYAKDIPVLFISTGAHRDYHTPEDKIEKVNFEGLQELLYFVSDIAVELASMPEKIEFTEAGPKTGSSSRGRMGGVTFGLMPDMTYDGDEGMPVTFVTEGKPAAAAGMQGGDIITAVDGKRVGNIYDYMDRLGQLKAGQSVIVTIKREGEVMELLLQL